MAAEAAVVGLGCKIWAQEYALCPLEGRWAAVAASQEGSSNSQQGLREEEISNNSSERKAKRQSMWKMKVMKTWPMHSFAAFKQETRMDRTQMWAKTLK